MRTATFLSLLASAGSAVAAPVAAAATTSAAAASSTGLAYTIGAGNGTNAYVDGQLFNIDGETKYYVGTNAWWLSHITSDSDVEAVMNEMSTAGLKVIRVWGFGQINDASEANGVYFQILTSSGATINYGDDGIARLDAVVHYAEQYGLKLVLPLANEWDDLGGINTYTTAFGCSETDFFSDTTCQGAYQDWISFVVNRYKASTAIFAWELMNEPRCTGCDTSVITNWASTTSAFIKSLDSDHMVTVGDEGWFNNTSIETSYPYGGGVGVDWEALLKIDTLDYATAHLYPGSWGENDTWGNAWIEEHQTLAAAAGVPFVLEEYGSTEASDRTEVEAQWQATFTGALDMFWQFESAVATDIASYGDSLDLQVGTDQWTTLVLDHISSVDAKTVSGATATAAAVAAVTSAASAESVTTTAVAVSTAAAATTPAVASSAVASSAVIVAPSATSAAAPASSTVVSSTGGDDEECDA